MHSIVRYSVCWEAFYTLLTIAQQILDGLLENLVNRLIIKGNLNALNLITMVHIKKKYVSESSDL